MLLFSLDHWKLCGAPGGRAHAGDGRGRRGDGGLPAARKHGGRSRSRVLDTALTTYCQGVFLHLSLLNETLWALATPLPAMGVASNPSAPPTALIALIGAVVGGSITAGAQLLVEDRRSQHDRQAERDRADRVRRERLEEAALLSRARLGSYGTISPAGRRYSKPARGLAIWWPRNCLGRTSFQTKTVASPPGT